MQGDHVIVRCFGGIPRVRRIWEQDEMGVYITDDACYERLLSGDAAIQPIGFPKEDVFQFDSAIAEKMDELVVTKEWDWNKLQPIASST